ncbi:MAG: (2Fe-2S) ferredoxin domain-containing protein [Bacteroidota bacterium]
MTKIKSLEELTTLKNKLNQDSLKNNSKVQIKVAMATCGIASGAKTIMDFMTDELEKRSIEAVVTQAGCMGYCYAEPTIEVTLPNTNPITFGFVDEKKAGEIITKYIMNKELVDGVIPINYETVDNI